MIDIVFNTSDAVINTRSNFEILAHVMEELGELSEEVIINEGLSYKSAGTDGIVGEAVDTMICILDLIRRAHPEITKEQLNAIAQVKCQKWLQKSKERKE